MVIDSKQRTCVYEHSQESKRAKVGGITMQVNEKVKKRKFCTLYISFEDSIRLIEAKGNRGAYFYSTLSILPDSLTAYKLRTIFRNF